MSDLILISILSNLKTFFIIICTISVFVLIIFWGVTSDIDFLEDKTNRREVKNKRNMFAIIAILCLIPATLLPDKKEVYLIYGVGTVINYVDGNETAKELPDKIVDIVDDYLTRQDSILKSNKNEGNTK